MVGLRRLQKEEKKKRQKDTFTIVISNVLRFLLEASFFYDKTWEGGSLEYLGFRISPQNIRTRFVESRIKPRQLCKNVQYFYLVWWENYLSRSFVGLEPNS